MTENSFACRFIASHPNTWRDNMRELKIRAKDDGELCILNYRPGADFSDRLVRECRGIIIDLDHLEVVCWPFDKFGNWFEDYAADIDWSTARCQTKIDGSLVKLYWHGGRWRWSTMSTIDASEANVSSTGMSYQGLIDDALERSGFDLGGFVGSKATHMFELVSPYTQNVVRYDEPKLWYLGSRDNVLGRECVYEQLKDSFDMPESYDVSDVDKVIEAAKALDGHEHEGFVIVDKGFNRIKVKSPEYVRLHHTVNNGMLTKAEAVRIVMENDTEAATMLSECEEFADALAYYTNNVLFLSFYIAGVCSLSRAKFTEVGEDRKRFALEWASMFPKNTKALTFMAIDYDVSANMFPDVVGQKVYCNMIEDYRP